MIPSSGAAREQRVDPALQIAAPVIGLHLVQRRDDVVERVGELAIIAVAHAEEGPGEIVDRPLAAGLLADDPVDVDPDQLALAVIILAALPAAPRLRRALGDDRIVGRVLERPPRAARRASTVSWRRSRRSRRACPASTACPSGRRGHSPRTASGPHRPTAGCPASASGNRASTGPLPRRYLPFQLWVYSCGSRLRSPSWFSQSVK